VAANIAQNAAVFGSFEEPCRARTCGKPMGPEPNNVDDPANRSLPHKFPRKHCTFDVEALAVIDHVFPAGFGNSCPCVRQLLQLSKWRFIGEIMFAGSHYFDSERSPIGRDSSGGNQPDIDIVKNL
jgi:hypothetical protein